MADAKISVLPSATTPLAGTEVLPIVQSGATKKVSVDNLTTGKTVPVGSLSVTGATPRISADMSNATQANRLMFQTTTANTNTSVGVIPNGTGTSSRVNLFNGSDPDNAGYVQLNSSAAASILNSSKTGTGTTLPIRLQIDGSTQFEVSTAGNLTVSTAAKGVNFTANTPAAGMTSQLLNWYEEGTFTPTFVPSGTGFTSITYATARGAQYIRVGRMVHVQIWLETTATTIGSASGVLRVGGLPFTTASSTGSTSNGFGALSVSYSTGFPGAAPQAAMPRANSTQIDLYYQTGTTTGPASQILATDMGTGAVALVLAGTYICA